MHRCLAIVIVLLGVLALLPLALLRADGELILDDSQLWAMIEEGQQIAVVRLQPDDRA